MIQIGIKLDPNTNKLGIDTNVTNKVTAAVLLQAVGLILGQMPEPEQKNIIPARSMPVFPEGR